MPISGMPWQKPGETVYLNASALTANILCDRHNSALSPLDDAAGRALPRIAEASAHAVNEANKRTKFFLIDGHALELWGLKTLANIFFGKIASVDGNERLADTHVLNTTALEEAFFGGGITPPCGLHVQPSNGDIHTASLGFVPLSTADKRTIGLLIQFSTIQLVFLLEQGPIPTARLASNPMYRPWNIIFEGRRNFSHTIVTWNNRPRELPTVNYQVGDLPA